MLKGNYVIFLISRYLLYQLANILFLLGTRANFFKFLIHIFYKDIKIVNLIQIFLQQSKIFVFRFFIKNF